MTDWLPSVYETFINTYERTAMDERPLTAVEFRAILEQCSNFGGALDANAAIKMLEGITGKTPAAPGVEAARQREIKENRNQAFSAGKTASMEIIRKYMESYRVGGKTQKICEELMRRIANSIR